MQLKRILLTISVICASVALTSCGGGDDHRVGQLAEVDAALAQLESKERADLAALSAAIADGKDPALIGQLKAAVIADENSENVLFNQVTLFSFVNASPESISTAAGDLAGIGSNLGSTNSSATSSTTQVLAAAEDEVSAAIARQFGIYGQEYQLLLDQANAFHQQFVDTLDASGGFQ